MTYAWAAAIGLLSGVCSGLFGVGGGIVMIPAMTLILGMDMKRAVGTSLLIIVPTAMMGSYKHYRSDHVDWRLAAAAIPFAVISGYLGAWLTLHVSSAALRRSFGVFLVGVGAYLFLSRPNTAARPASPATSAPPAEQPR